MSSEYLEIGPTPCEESCQQVGTPGYDSVAAWNECSRYIELIDKCFGHPPYGASLRIKSNRHDFGTYYEVAVRYDPDNDLAVKYAFAVEADTRKRLWNTVSSPVGKVD